MRPNIQGRIDNAKCYEMVRAFVGPKVSNVRIVMQRKSPKTVTMKPNRNLGDTSAEWTTKPSTI